MKRSDFFSVVSRFARVFLVVHRRGLILGAFVFLVLCVSCVRHYTPEPGPAVPTVIENTGTRKMKEREEIIQWLADYAVYEQEYSDIPASITIAQAILETGWLRTDTPTRQRMIYDAKNLFGIKGTGTAGYVEIPTHEYINGRMVSVTAKFRAYHTFGESFEDHSRLLTTSRYYTGALNYRDDPRRYIGEVAKKYATDPNYADKVWSIVTRYDLTRFDKHGNGRPGPQE